MRIARFGWVGIGFLAAAAAAAIPTAAGAARATSSGPDAAPPTPTPSVSAAAPPASSADARALFRKVIDGIGGKERIDKIQDVRTRGQVTAKAPSGDLTMDMVTQIVFPDRLSQQVDSQLGRFVMVATPRSSFLLGEQGVQDLPPGMGDELLRQVRRGAFFMAQKSADPKLELKAGGEEKVGNVQAKILDVAYGDAAVRWYVDPATGRILRSAHDAKNPGGKTVHVTTEYSEYKTEDGITLPRRLEVSTDGTPDQVLVLDEIKINAGVDPKTFERPPAPTPTPPLK